MPQSPTDRAIVDLVNAWNSLAPTADEGFPYRLISEMVADGSTNKLEHARAITSSLYDGLAYGNWPSTVRALAK